MAKLHQTYIAQPASTFFYIRNPKDYKQILQVQSKEGDHYKCFLVTGGSGSNINVDSTKAIYVHQECEIKQHAP